MILFIFIFIYVIFICILLIHICVIIYKTLCLRHINRQFNPHFQILLSKNQLDSCCLLMILSTDNFPIINIGISVHSYDNRDSNSYTSQKWESIMKHIE